MSNALPHSSTPSIFHTTADAHADERTHWNEHTNAYTETTTASFQRRRRAFVNLIHGTLAVA
jgi:hypothetical protein